MFGSSIWLHAEFAFVISTFEQTELPTLQPIEDGGATVWQPKSP
jgi:hypothetical protein